MPALGVTVQAIAEMADDDDQGYVHKLADIIHQDAAMTMQVLRLTNGAYHIPRTKKLNTVNRALVMLGFDEVRSLCLTVAVIGKLLTGSSRDQVIAEMGRAFHAAVQARSLAYQRGDTAAEEIFTATLLYRLGEMAFWCFGGESADKLAEEMSSSTQRPKSEIEQEFLGFKLEELTQGLCAAWGLGPTLEKAWSEAESPDSRWRAVKLSHMFAEAVEKGWDSQEVRDVVAEMAVYTGVAPEQMEETLRENAEEAVTMAKGFGARAAGERIPLPVPGKASIAADSSEGSVESLQARSFLDPDPMVQLKILREISTKLESGTDVSEMLELILEGIYLGLGMDRALFALLSPNRKFLRIKSARGFSTQALMQNFRFEITPDAPTIFHFIVESQSALWVPDRNAAAIQKLIPENISSVIGHSPFFVSPTIVDSKPIGLFFADRQESSRELTHEDYDSFKQFCIQAELALAHLDTLHSRGAQA